MCKDALSINTNFFNSKKKKRLVEVSTLAMPLLRRDLGENLAQGPHFTALPGHPDCQQRQLDESLLAIARLLFPSSAPTLPEMALQCWHLSNYNKTQKQFEKIYSQILVHSIWSACPGLANETSADRLERAARSSCHQSL